MHTRPFFLFLLLVVAGFPLVFGSSSWAQEIRIDGGGGWSIPTTDAVNLSAEDVENLQVSVNIHSGPHAYAGAGFVRSIGERFALGARLRAHVSRIRATTDCPSCRNPEGDLRAATVEGRIIITAPEWIHPYLLVGIGVVHTTVDRVTARNVQTPDLPETIHFERASVLDAGGDVGLGASLPMIAGLYLDAEIRATGSLPGGKENTVTMLPFSLGLSYGFD